MKILSSAKISPKHQERLKEKFPQGDFYFFDNMKEAVKEIDNAEVLVTYGVDVTDDLIDQAKKLKWIQVISAGIDQLPFEKLQERGVIVTNAKGIHHIQMAEYTMAVILQLARKINELQKNQEIRKWDQTVRTSEIYGTTLGIIGYGSIGAGIAEKAKVFGMKVIGLNTDGRPAKHVDQMVNPKQIELLLRESDYVVLIVPLTEDTYHLIGKKELKAMKDTAYLINIARGQVVDDEALINALQNKEIAGAALDVFVEEPLPVDHPYWGLENVILTPHMSGKSPNYMQRALEIFEENLEKYQNNETSQLLNFINLIKKY